MLTKNSYRTFLALGFGILALSLTGCDEAKRQHQEFVNQQRKQWDLTLLGVKYEQALQQYQTGDYDKCRDTLKDALAADIPFAPMHVLIAKVDLEGGSLEDAATQLKKAIQIKGDDAEPYYLLGVVYQRYQQFDTAADYYQQAVSKKSSEAPYVLALAEMKISGGHLDEAKQILEDKMMYFEQSAAMRVALAKVATLQGDPATAAKHYRDATLLVPENANVRWSYAVALFDAGKYSESAKILEELRKDPPVMPKSRDLTKKDDPQFDEQAEKATKSALLITLGQAYVNLHRPLDAKDCFQELIRIEPENVSAYLSLGKTCLITNDLSITLATAKKVLRTEPNNVSAMILEAAALQKQKKWAEALDALTVAEKLSPKDSTIMCMEGLSTMQLGKKDEAAVYFVKAMAMNPTDTWAGELLARVRPTAPSLSPGASAIPGGVPVPEAALVKDPAVKQANNAGETANGTEKPVVTDAEPTGTPDNARRDDQ